jgi:hypothetical protein
MLSLCLRSLKRYVQATGQQDEDISGNFDQFIRTNRLHKIAAHLTTKKPAVPATVGISIPTAPHLCFGKPEVNFCPSVDPLPGNGLHGPQKAVSGALFFPELNTFYLSPIVHYWLRIAKNRKLLKLI